MPAFTELEQLARQEAIDLIPDIEPVDLELMVRWRLVIFQHPHVMTYPVTRKFMEAMVEKYIDSIQ